MKFASELTSKQMKMVSSAAATTASQCGSLKIHSLIVWHLKGTYVVALTFITVQQSILG